MRLENIDVENVQNLSDDELQNLRNRANQLYISTQYWKTNIRKKQLGKNNPIDENSFFSSYELLVKEIQKRKLKYNKNELDYKLIEKNTRNIDVPSLPVVFLKENVAAITGKFASNPKKADNVNLWIDGLFNEDISRFINNIVKSETDKNVENKEVSKNDTYISLYDLVLLPKDKTKEQKITDENIGNFEKSTSPNNNELIKIDLIHKEENTTFIKNDEKQIVGGVVYAVNELDSDNEYVESAEEIYNAMESWMLKGHIMKFMHKGKPQEVFPIEVFQAEEDTMKGGDVIPAGAWYVTAKVLNTDLWEGCKSGEITGFSMAGTGTKVTEN